MSDKLVVISWKWSTPGYRSTFGPETVNTLKRMVARHYKRPHEFVCITDDARGIDADVRIIKLWKDLADVPSPYGRRGPSCYRRLKAYSAEAAEFIGPRFVSLDLDCVITGDLEPLWDRPDDFVIWGDTARGTPYNGSMFLMTAGARRQAWEQFDRVRSPKASLAAGFIGSDQGWLGVVLGPNEKRWTAADGVYSYRNEIAPKGGRLPPGARIVFFHGRWDPWMAQIRQRHRWVEEHYR